MGTAQTHALPSLHGGSLQNTLTVPLILKQYIEDHIISINP